MAYLLNCIKWRETSVFNQPTFTAKTLKSKKFQRDLPESKQNMPLLTMKIAFGRASRRVSQTRGSSKKSKDKQAGSHRNKTKAAKTDRKARRAPSIRDLQKAFDASSSEIIEYEEEPRVRRPPEDRLVAAMSGPESAGPESAGPEAAAQESAAPAELKRNEDVTSSPPDVTTDEALTTAKPETKRKRKAYRWYFKPRNGDIFIVEYLHQNFNTPRHLRFIDVPHTKNADHPSWKPRRNHSTCYNDCLTNELIQSGVAITGSAGFDGKATSYACSCCSETVSVAFKMSCLQGRNSTWKGGYICETCLYCIQSKRNHHPWLRTDL